MNTRLYVLIALLLIVIGYALGYYTLPQKVVTQTVTEVKTVTVIQHDVQTVTKEIIKPDGTKEIDTVTTDKSVDTSKSEEKIDKTKIVEIGKPQWKANVQFSPKETKYAYVYGVQIERRILGPVFLGVFGNMDRTLGVSVGLEF